MKQKIFFENKDGFKIAAIYSSPGDTDSIVIMCHGLNSSKDSKTNQALEEIFSKNNIASLQMDFFGHGESEGNKEDADMNDFVDDVLLAVSYVKGLGYKNIGLYGCSFGGMAVVIAASKNPSIKVMALKAPGFGQSSRKMKRYEKDFTGKTWIKAGAKVKMPVLIVHGTSDEHVEFSQGEELSKSIPQCEFKVFIGVDHQFTKKKDFDGMIKDISDFVIKNIR